MIVFFSGTGNSRYVAQMLARALDDEILDAGKHIKAGEKCVLHSDKPWVFAAPIYGWQVPHLFADYIRATRFSGSGEAYFVMTCGSDIGDASAHAAQLCHEKQLSYRGMLEVVMPENYIAMFPVPEDAESARIIAKARPVVQQGAELIRQGKPFPEKKTGILDRLKSGLVNRVFYLVKTLSLML